jgi:PIN domain nuclease of toxin-antitoxin system
MGTVRLLLDTCCFLWLALEPGKVSKAATQAFDDPANARLMSDASILEIVIKHSKGKLPLPGEPRAWLPDRLAFFQIQVLPISHNAIFRSGELPRVHNDPFDRLLAAQAIEEMLNVLSPDAPFSTLGASRVW